MSTNNAMTRTVRKKPARGKSQGNAKEMEYNSMMPAREIKNLRVSCNAAMAFILEFSSTVPFFGN
jgi:hypothetical protein